MTLLRASLLLAAACAAAACAGEAAAPSVKAQVGPSDLRSMDRGILFMVQQPVTTLSRDVFPLAPYSVALQPDPIGTYGRVLIDLDRDRQPDEVWVVESPERVKRMISTADDGVNYDRTLWLKDGVWTAEATQD